MSDHCYQRFNVVLRCNFPCVNHVHFTCIFTFGHHWNDRRLVDDNALIQRVNVYGFYHIICRFGFGVGFHCFFNKFPHKFKHTCTVRVL